MRALVEATAFRKDVKRAHKRGFDLQKLGAIIKKLQNGEALPAANPAHPLKGEWKGYWDCHIEPDWLLRGVEQKPGNRRFPGQDCRRSANLLYYGCERCPGDRPKERP